MQFAEKETRQKPNLFQVYITHWVKTPHSGWLTELAGSAAHSADVFTWAERQTGRDGEWGRQKDVASASRLKSNWFVFFSEDVWAWLVAHVLTADRKQSHFHSTKSLRLFCQESKLCFSPQSDRALPGHICFCGGDALCSVGLILRQTATPSSRSLLGPSHLLRKWQERGDGLVFIFSFLEPRAKNTLPELLKIW